MFVSEYRKLLADRLLQMCSFDVSREVKNSLSVHTSCMYMYVNKLHSYYWIIVKGSDNG